MTIECDLPPPNIRRVFCDANWVGKPGFVKKLKFDAGRQDHRSEFHKRSQLFILSHTTKRFPSSRCAPATKIVRPLESTAETQRQLEAALLRLSAMISSKQWRIRGGGLAGQIGLLL